MPNNVRLLFARFFGVHFPFFSLPPIFSGGLVKIELTRAAPASLHVSPSRFANRVAGPGFVAIVPPNTLLSVKAISDGKAIVVDCPSRADMGLAASENTGLADLSITAAPAKHIDW